MTGSTVVVVFLPADSFEADLAASICRTCPVRVQCLDEAMATEGVHHHGIWGGLTAGERGALEMRRQVESVGDPPLVGIAFGTFSSVRERLTRKEFQDVLVFLGFVLFLLTTVAVVLIVHKSWSTDQWDALAAVAASLQALGVLFALV